MCGVFGFVSHDGNGPRDATLAKIARDTESRGPHSWGVAWIDPRGRLRMYKQPGRITASLDKLAELTDGATALVGHCRWATHGTPNANENNHPHPVDGGWFVHNGQVRNHRHLTERHSLHPVSDCDSEVLGLMVETGDGRTLVDRVHDATAAAQGALVFAGIWARPHRLLLARRGKPLHVTELEGRSYFASRPHALPGRPYAVDNETLLELRPGRTPEAWGIVPAEQIPPPPVPTRRGHGRLAVPGELNWTPPRGRFNDPGCAVRFV